LAWKNANFSSLILGRGIYAVNTRHFARTTERNYNFKRFHVETQQVKDAKVAPGKKP
jgi:hypothetical protein